MSLTWSILNGSIRTGQFRFFFVRNILITTLYPLYVLTGHFQPLCYHIYKNAYIPVVPIVPIWEHAIIQKFDTFLNFFCNILIIYYFLCSVLKFHDFRSTNSRVGHDWVNRYDGTNSLRISSFPIRRSS